MTAATSVERLHVVHVINHLPVGGAERFLSLLAPAQARAGARVAVLSLVEPNPLAAALVDAGVEFAAMGRQRLNDPRLALDLWRDFRARRPDIVHTHLFYADTFGRVAARRAGVRAIVSTEHSTEGGHLSRRRRAAMRLGARLASRLVAVSEEVRAAASVRLRIPAADIAVVPNGIELASWSDAEPLPRDTFRIDEDTLLIGCVGRLDAPKGHDVLLEALAQLRIPKWAVLVVGDGPLRPELETRARELGLEGRVRWLGTRADVPRILKMLDVFALPSRYEGHSMALLEAMASGRACLVSRIPEIEATLGGAGTYASSGDPAAWARALESLAADPDGRASAARAAQQAAQRFGIEASAAAYARIYRETLAEARSRPR